MRWEKLRIAGVCGIPAVKFSAGQPAKNFGRKLCGFYKRAPGKFLCTTCTKIDPEIFLAFFPHTLYNTKWFWAEACGFRPKYTPNRGAALLHLH